MEKIKKGDVVSRNSYGNDILFIVHRVIRSRKNPTIYILKGLTVRIEADSKEEDLIRIESKKVSNRMQQIDDRWKQRSARRLRESNIGNSQFKRILNTRESREYVYTGKILHLDGDKRYTDKSYRYYKQLGLDAVVKNIAENKQPMMIRSLLERYQPDILVITGHDAMVKNPRQYDDISNYRNSKYFARTVKEARTWDKEGKLVIFAGACQSYFELLMASRSKFCFFTCQSIN